MKRARKMVLIGAGSAMFTQGLVADMIAANSGYSWTLGLCDIEPGVLRSITGLCRKMAAAKNADIKIESSADRKQLLKGADYVVTTVGVGGRRAWEQDVFIPRKYGIFQPVGDTALPGGISRAMRMIPVMVDIANDIKELCPDAVFINYSNPMTAICRAVRKQTGVNVIGLCHGVFHTEGELSRLCGYDEKDVTSLCFGINHLTYIYDFRHKGKSAFCALKDKQKAIGPFTWEHFNAYGLFPAPGDRHITEFFPERFADGGYYGKKLGVDAFSFEDVIALGDKICEETFLQGDNDDPLPRDFFEKMEGEHEQLADIINSLEFDERKIFSANLPNGGMIAGLPDDAVLEMSAVAGGYGFIPLQIGAIPSAVLAIIARHTAVVETAVDAALNGDKKLFVQAVMMSSAMTDYDRAEEMADELIEAQRAFLPQF